jgi:hypothetical protein
MIDSFSMNRCTKDRFLFDGLNNARHHPPGWSEMTMSFIMPRTWYWGPGAPEYWPIIKGPFQGVLSGRQGTSATSSPF